MKTFIVGLVVLLAFSTQANAAEKITWMVLDWPPWMILKGENQGKGRFNHILKTAQENLPQYDHVNEEMNWSRFWHEVKSGTDLCYPFGLKTGKRESLVYYSEPHTFVLPNAVIMKKETVEKLGFPASLSIVDLLKDQRFNGYAQKNRSFTKLVDDLLKQHEPDANLARVSESAESLVRMVKSGRIDYIIEYPIVASYYDRIKGEPGGLSSIPIAEMEPFAYVYMCCTRNTWGKRVIERWNKVLRRIKPTPEYRKMTEIGHTDPKELETIQQCYDKFLLAK